MYMLQFSGFVLKRVSATCSPSGIRLVSFYGNSRNFEKFTGYRKKISIWMREQGVQVARACIRQLEFIVGQRIRRSVQIFHLYTRIWDEVALREFARTWRFRMLKNTRHLFMSAVGVTMYNWDRERITDEELNSCKQEIEGIHRLKDRTVVCSKCHLRVIIDMTQPGVKYCKCSGSKSASRSKQDEEGWQPFIEREDMLIWRREEPCSGGLFAYKVYGSFADVTADDFLQVQIDVDYRRQWDPTARELEIVDTDPTSKMSVNHSNDIIYWEMIWPRLFANRDYVYQRRWVIDKENQLIVIISKITEHPSVPRRPGVYRVTSYWSYMVIRPHTEFHQPGIEFGLTYFDDPGVNIPAAVTAWVAMTGLPDFLIRMRQASKEYQGYKIIKQATRAPDADYISGTDDDGNDDGNDDCDDDDDDNDNDDDVSQQDMIPTNRDISDRGELGREEDSVSKEDSTDETGALKLPNQLEEEEEEEQGYNRDDNEKQDKTINTSDEEEQGLLNCFFRTRLFA